MHRGPRLFHDFGRILESPMVSLNTRTRNRLRNTKWSTMTMGSWINGRDGDPHHRRHRHATTKSMLSNVFVHFKLWIDERERIVPRCLVPTKATSKKRKRLSPKCTPRRRDAARKRHDAGAAIGEGKGEGGMAREV